MKLIILSLLASVCLAQQPVLIREGGNTVDVTASSALKVDGSAVTQPVSAASLPLPSGAATAAKQPALGTAGTASADVISVQGIASMTPLLVNGSGVTQPVSGTVTVTQGTGTNLHMVCDSGCTPGGSFDDDSAFTFGMTAINVAGYVFDDTMPNAVTENNAAAPRMSVNRVPYGIIRDGELNERAAYVTAGNALKVDASDTTQPISGTVTANAGTGDFTVVNAGTFAVQAAQSGTWNITNISGTVSLPTGASTLAEQQTQTTALQLIDDTVATTASAITTKGIAAAGTDGTNARILKTDTGGELQVDVLTLPSVTIGTFPDNEPFNVAQINGVTPLMGAGNTGTGSLRVTLSTDQAAVATWGYAATGAAPPVNAQLQGGIGSGATAGLLTAPTVCDQWVAINGTASAQLITGVSGRKVYFCSGNIQMNGGANTLSFVSGTGTVCATGITAIPGFDGATTAANGYSFAANSGMTWAGANGAAFARSTNNADNICILVGSATRVVGGLSYAIY